MSYKTILVHLTDERRVPALVNAAAQVAALNDAHVTALYVMPPVPTYGVRALGAGMLSSAQKAFHDEAARVEAAYKKAIAGRTIKSDWRLIEPADDDIAGIVLDQARSADLVVASQRNRDAEYSHVLDVPERLVLECGRPVLLVPRIGHYPVIGKRVTIAWNTRREAARATFDALPLLKAASAVRIIWVNPKADGATSGDLPGAEIATTLARHGVKCEVAATVSKDISAADTILSGLTDDGTDLLVMGAWGHSRVRELVFGGVTRHILEHMTVPVLMSH